MHAYAKGVLEPEEAKLSGEEVTDLTSRCHSMQAHETHKATENRAKCWKYGTASSVTQETRGTRGRGKNTTLRREEKVVVVLGPRGMAVRARTHAVVCDAVHGSCVLCVHGRT